MQVKTVVVGYGDRGSIYADYAARFPDELKIEAIVDPDVFRLGLAKEKFNLSDDQCLTDFDALIAKGKIADFAIVATMDQLHYEQAKALLLQNYHLLLEKPVVNNSKELQNLKKLAEERDRIIMVGHVLRYTPFYGAIKQAILDGEVGKIMHMETSELVGVCHSSSSYIRGNINSTSYHNARCFEFYLDANYCRSRTRVPYYYEAFVDGELNSETECTMTAELFLSWKDLYYTPEELGENGYPEDIQMYVNYEGEANEVLGSCSWRQETYFYYGKDGYLGELPHEEYGDIESGFASTDQWTLTEDNKPQTTAGRTQILWLKDAFAKDFMFEATLKPLSTTADGKRITLRGEDVYGRIGLVSAVPQGRYNVFSADATGIAQGQVQLQTCQQIDSFHWQNLIGKYEVVTSDYTEDILTMRVVKQGDMNRSRCI